MSGSNRIIEVVFDDSAAGAMSFAARDDRRFGEIAPLYLMADIGDIRKPMHSEYRRKLIESLYFQNQWVDEEENEEEEIPSPKDIIASFGKKLRESDAVRVWVSDCAYSRCGFLHLCTMLEGYSGKVYAVDLPRMTAITDGLAEHYSWSECEPGFFMKAVDNAVEIPEGTIKACADKWKKLRYENAPLRVVLGGDIISAPANFYDFLILRYLDSPMKEAVLIGKILCANRIGVGDYWYAKRIEQFIEKGKIRVVEDDKSRYNRLIERIE